MRNARASPLTHAGGACVETPAWNTKFEGETHQAGAQRMKSISGPVAAIAAALFVFTAPAAEARSAAHGTSHGGGMSIPYIGRISSLGALRHGSIPNLAALRNGSIPNLAALRQWIDPAPRLSPGLAAAFRIDPRARLAPEPGFARARSARSGRWVASAALAVSAAGSAAAAMPVPLTSDRRLTSKNSPSSPGLSRRPRSCGTAVP